MTTEQINDYFINHPLMLIVLGIVLVWSLVWKGFALWKAAHHNDRGWFVVLLVVNTMGLLEILYIFVFSRRKMEVSQKKEQEV